MRRLSIFAVSLALFACLLGGCGTAGQKVEVDPTPAASVTTSAYSDQWLSIDVPAGFQAVSCGSGFDHVLRVYDPTAPDCQVFLMLKYQPLLKSQAGQDYWKKLAVKKPAFAIYGAAPVMARPSTAAFFMRLEPSLTLASSFSPELKDCAWPQVDDLMPLETAATQSLLAASSADDAIVRASFQGGQGLCEGLFSADVVDHGPLFAGSTDISYYLVYDIVFISASASSFSEWQGVLSRCLASLKFNDGFTSSLQDQDGYMTGGQLNDEVQAVQASLDAAWAGRSAHFDAQLQSQGDQQAGYVRVKDVKTGKVYKAAADWADTYKGDDYELVSADQDYAQPVEGYVKIAG